MSTYYTTLRFEVLTAVSMFLIVTPCGLGGVTAQDIGYITSFHHLNLDCSIIQKRFLGCATEHHGFIPFQSKLTWS